MKEIWKDVAYYEDLYQISNYGRLKSKSRIINGKNQYDVIFSYKVNERIIRPRIDKKGYIHYALNKEGKTKEFKAHRLVALMFVPNPYNKPQVNHINGIKTDNRVDNLEWCTNSENQLHSYKINKNRRNVFRENNPRKRKAIDIFAIQIK